MRYIRRNKDYFEDYLDSSGRYLESLYGIRDKHSDIKGKIQVDISIISQLESCLIVEYSAGCDKGTMQKRLKMLKDAYR